MSVLVGSYEESCSIEAANGELGPPKESSSSSRSRQGLLAGLLTGVDDRKRGSASDVPHLWSFVETVACTTEKDRPNY